MYRANPNTWSPGAKGAVGDQRLQNQDKSLIPTTVFILMHVLDYELWVVHRRSRTSALWEHENSHGLPKSAKERHRDFPKVGTVAVLGSLA